MTKQASCFLVSKDGTDSLQWQDSLSPEREGDFLFALLPIEMNNNNCPFPDSLLISSTSTSLCLLFQMSGGFMSQIQKVMALFLR